jgi:hypothetical protein
MCNQTIITPESAKGPGYDYHHLGYYATSHDWSKTLSDNITMLLVVFRYWEGFLFIQLGTFTSVWLLLIAESVEWIGQKALADLNCS